MMVDLQARYIPRGQYEVRKVGEHFDGSHALEIWTDLDRLCRATMCIENTPPPEGHVWIKDWGENTGLFDALVEAGVIEDAGKTFAVNKWGMKARLAKLTETILESAI